jgi:hypothetical protein
MWKGALTLIAGMLVCLVPPVLADTISPLPATCTPTTLNNYIALGATGCSLGHVAFFGFVFTVVAFGGGIAPASASDVTVTPTVIDEHYSLNFFSTRFAATGSEFVTYLLAYTVDPHPIITFSDELQVESPKFPGLVSVTTDLCLNAPFTPSCLGSPAAVMVFDNGISAQFLDSVVFPPIPPGNLLGIRNNVSLQANGSSADFSSLTNSVGFVVEPTDTLLTGSGLLGLLWCFARRLRPESVKGAVQFPPEVRVTPAASDRGN